MEEKTYQFKRPALYMEYGTVTAHNVEDAKQLIKDGNYDDIFNVCLEETYDEDIVIEGEI